MAESIELKDLDSGGRGEDLPPPPDTIEETTVTETAGGDSDKQISLKVRPLKKRPSTSKANKSKRIREREEEYPDSDIPSTKGLSWSTALANTVDKKFLERVAGTVAIKGDGKNSKYLFDNLDLSVYGKTGSTKDVRFNVKPNVLDRRGGEVVVTDLDLQNVIHEAREEYRVRLPDKDMISREIAARGLPPSSAQIESINFGVRKRMSDRVTDLGR